MMIDDSEVDNLRSTVSDALTAANMLYWMSAVRLMYGVVSWCLEKWSPTYRKSEKKLNLTNYRLQLMVYTALSRLST